ncbi:MAG: CoA transferase [Marinovum sp.]|nr:CoA transferase [Marinovum sp.]
MALDGELEGISVVSLEQAVAAPYCGMLLADAGARVIKVERPEGDFARGYDKGAEGQSAIFAWLNRGKEALCLNLKDAKDFAVLIEMITRSDILLSNLAPGAMDRLGLNGAVLRQKTPGLITCRISGYGESGPAAQKKAYDFLVQAETGICAVTGSPEAPARVGISVTDISTGLTAFSAILRALIQRGRTGQGVDLSISMFDVMADWMNMPLLAHRYMGGAPDRMGLKHSFIAPYGAFVCADDQQVLLAIQSDREFSIFCDQVLGQPELAKDPKFADNPARYAKREELYAIVTQCFSQFSANSVAERLDAAGIANATLNSVADLSAHPCLKNSAASFGAAKITMAALPIPSAQAAVKMVPTLDQHGDAIRREFAPQHSKVKKDEL